MSLDADLAAVRAELHALRADVTLWRSELREDRQQALDEINRRLTAYSSRLRSVERWRAWMTGALAVIGVAWAAVRGWYLNGAGK